MKKIISILLCAIMILGLVGCGSSAKPKQDDQAATTEQKPVVTIEELPLDIKIL